jgi:hypothetical protein
MGEADRALKVLLIRPINSRSSSEQVEQGVKLQVRGNKKVYKFVNN